MGLQLGDGSHRRNHRRAAGHVVFHLVHVLGGLDGDAAGIEGDSLAHQAQNRRGRRRGWQVFQDDERGRFGAALGHGQERVHLQFFATGAIQHVA